MADKADMSVEEIKEEIAGKDKSKFLTFLVFLLISAALWFLIKLTKDYTTQTEFTVVYTEVPASKWISTPEQQVKLSFVADGFATLRHNLVRPQRRVVTVSLNEVPYRLEGGNTYSYSTQYVAERVADWLGVPSGNVTVNDDKQFFNMEELQSKEVPVEVPIDVKTQRQYYVYGDPQVEPALVTVYGPKNVLDTLKSVRTAVFSAANASDRLTQTLSIDYYGGMVRSEQATAEVTVEVEQYTETDIEVPVKVTDTVNCRFFPETMKVKCLVPIRDFANVNAASFLVLADTAQLHRLEPLLDIRLTKVPEHVQVMKTEPDQVEYLIIN
ncbi:MAG: YbbR-like domain-containing protein [Bacteroidales bacterium]|nr:YbbR-like domain-containing protein [Bacteroidales bacterium]